MSLYGAELCWRLAGLIVGPGNRVDYVEYVKELADHPDYEAILRAVKQAA